MTAWIVGFLILVAGAIITYATRPSVREPYGDAHG